MEARGSRWMGLGYVCISSVGKLLKNYARIILTSHVLFSKYVDHPQEKTSSTVVCEGMLEL